MAEYRSASTEETEKIGAELAQMLCPGDIICMYGDLGAGKTAFTKGLAKGLGITDYVNSPTFTIVNLYEGRLKLYHFDVYRIEDSEELYDIGFDEYLFGDGVSVIEWAEKIEDVLPRGRYNVTITLEETQNEDLFASPDRRIVIEKQEETSQ